ELSDRLRPRKVRSRWSVVLFRLVGDVLPEPLVTAAAQVDDGRSSRPLPERQLEPLELGAVDDDLELEQSRSELRHARSLRTSAPSSDAAEFLGRGPE